jgi:hypothetical protein
MAGCTAQVTHTASPAVTATTALHSAVTATSKRIFTVGVVANLIDQNGNHSYDGYLANSDIYLNTFTFLGSGETAEYHRVGINSTEESWASLTSLLTAKAGTRIYIDSPGSGDQGSVVSSVQDTATGNTITRVITWHSTQGAPPTTTVTLTVNKASVITAAGIQHSWELDPGMSDGCSHYPALGYCLATVEYTYGNTAAQDSMILAVSRYEDQIADPDTKAVFSALLEDLAATAKAHPVNQEVLATFVRDTFLDPTDGGAMMTIGDITFNAKTGMYTLYTQTWGDTTTKPTVAAAIAVTKGLVTMFGVTGEEPTPVLYATE